MTLEYFKLNISILFILDFTLNGCVPTWLRRCRRNNWSSIRGLSVSLNELGFFFDNRIGNLKKKKERNSPVMKDYSFLHDMLNAHDNFVFVEIYFYINDTREI